ncbi:hypothetical protein CPB86DRAFT_276077 [Serendipita vermifera]|nr:hypothetical protein CPB86DRAFT_276077 [Serendipita vermifera]
MNEAPSPQDYIHYLITNRKATLAPWVSGCALDIFGAGIYFSHLVRYFMSPTVRRPGSRKVTILVCVVAVLSACKTAAALYVLFLNAILLSEDPLRLAVAELNNWVMVIEPLTTHIVDLTVQSYYILLLHRLFQYDGGYRFYPAFRWILFALIFGCIIASTTMGILAVDEMLSLRFIHVRAYLVSQLVVSFFADAFITSGTVYCLIKTKSDTTRTQSVLSRFARIIALSAAVPALFALLNVSIVGANVYFNRWHVLFDYGLSKAFAISLMWTIEVRSKILDPESSHHRGAAHSTSVAERHSREGSHNLLSRPSIFAATVQVDALPSVVAGRELEMKDYRQSNAHDINHPFAAGYVSPSSSEIMRWKV